MLVVLEHRYFGESFPVNDLSEDNLQYLTVGQALADLQSFAQSGMGNRGLIAASRPRSGKEYVPWVLIGGGYAGELAPVHDYGEKQLTLPTAFQVHWCTGR